MATTTTIFVVSMTQGLYDMEQTRVVKSFRVKEEALEFIKRLDQIIRTPTLSFELIKEKLTAVHPRAVDGNCDDDLPDYTCVECELV